MSSPFTVLSNFSLAALIPLSISGFNLKSNFLAVACALKF